MAAIVPQPRLLQVVPHYTPNPDINRNIANVLWFRNNLAGTPGLADLVSISNVFNINWAPIFTRIGATAMHYLGCVITDFSSNFGIQYDSRGVFTPTPGNQGVANPAQVAGLISYSNGERFRGGHFRTYLPYVGDGALDATDKNNLSQTAITTLTDAVNSVTSSMQASGVLGGQQWVLFRHRTNATLARVDPIISFKVQLTTATQRRRLRKVPRHRKA